MKHNINVDKELHLVKDNYDRYPPINKVLDTEDFNEEIFLDTTLLNNFNINENEK